jgi:hypothetical protein
MINKYQPHSGSSAFTYIAWQLETVNRKGLQVTKSLEASPALEVGGLKGLC